MYICVWGVCVSSHRLVHAILQVCFWGEDFVRARWAQRFGHLRQQQEVVEQEAVELFAALGFEQLPAVEELSGTQTVGDRVEHQLLEDGEGEAIISKRLLKWFVHVYDGSFLG